MAIGCSLAPDPAWLPGRDSGARQAMSGVDVRDDHPEWSQWMAAAQDGDASAYRRLLHEITPLLRRVAAHRLYGAPAADIEDVVQDVLLSVHAVRHTYDPARPFVPWLMAIERYRLADWQRRRARRNANEVAVDSLAETFAAQAANREQQEAFDGREIHAAVADLPPAQRTAITLLKLKELSLKEASARTGMTETALKVATHRGMKTLRRLFGKDSA
jgi:RNA polymerase sigma-70 factor (ECF subfamily)